MRPKLYQVQPNTDFSVILYYDNGEIKKYDCGWFLNEGGIFEELHDIGTFIEFCTVMNGTLAFDISRQFDPTNCVDICPDIVYEESVAVNNVSVA